MPSLDRCVVNDKLVLLLVLCARRNFDDFLNKAKGVKHLFEVCIPFEVLFLNFALLKTVSKTIQMRRRNFWTITYLDGSPSEKGTAKKLVFLGYALEKDV